MRSNYATVKIPQELAKTLDEFAADMGYRSRAEIVNDAIRRFIDERKRLDHSLVEGVTEPRLKEKIAPEIVH